MSATITKPDTKQTETSAVEDVLSAAVSRRDFLTLAWKSLLGLSSLFGLGAVWRYLSYKPDPTPVTRFDLGPVDNFPPGVEFKVSEAQAHVMHTAEGFRAYSLVCPHLGCIVDPTENGFLCPCHGSRYDKTGAYLFGPSAKSLRALQVEITTEGHLLIDTAERAA